ncbi:MAG: inositol monophosphatase [Anaerolineae bacterium]|jgi:myo-inositol-1(or 4)-monophosphatase|nr:inositol monophosphatase [Anaerolineae bacterium]
MTHYEPWLHTALEAADAVGGYLRGVWRTDHAVQSKGYRDIVTDADLVAESMILQRLRRAFPDHAVTSEEAGADVQGPVIRWLVDPIDGTTNFSRDNPNFCISIAAVENGCPVVGVIADALRGLTFAACAGGGATLNGTPIHVSDVTTLTSAIFALDTPKVADLRRQTWRYVDRLLASARTLRALGSAALNMAYVAAGWTDAYFNVAMKPWDQAAGGLIVLEAGGAVSTLSGEVWTPYRPDPLMAASPDLVEAMRDLWDRGESLETE